MSRKFDAVVLGTGAAGLMCAIEAGKRGRRVAVMERAEKIGKKILISGGGRCNFTNLYCTPENFISANPHFAKSALARYTPMDFISLVEKHRISYHEKTLGQLFCDRAANDITEMLEEECLAAGVKIFLNQRVKEISRTTEFVVRRRGGVSCPGTGCRYGRAIHSKDGRNFIWLRRRAAIWIEDSEDEAGPGAVDVWREGEEEYCDLAGVSMEVIAQADGHAFPEKMLVTHWD